MVAPGDAMARQAAVLVVALLLAWPALVNGYPIVFSDTHAFLVQAGEPRMVWDKPWAYGPFLLALHGNTTLWLPLAGQALILSHVLWLLAASLGQATPLRHVLLGGALAVGSAAPWVASLLMPDMFAPVVVLGLYLLAFPGGVGRWQLGWIAGLVACAIAFHLSHLVLAAACLAVILVLRGRMRAFVPFGVAVCVLLASNVVGYGRFALSPYGVVFALARLSADGNVAPVLARRCPAVGWHMCAWRGRLPADSNVFLWDGAGPVWTAPGGPAGLAPEAAAIVAAAIGDDPLGIARSVLANGFRQIGRVGLGDTLRPDWLEGSITGSLGAYFPAQELARFRAGLQARGGLAGVAAPFTAPHAALLILAALAAPLVPRRLWPLGALVVVGVVANAFATGALSGVFDRYQARIAWLVLLPPALALLRWVPAPRPRPGTCGRAAHSH